MVYGLFIAKKKFVSPLVTSMMMAYKPWCFDQMTVADLGFSKGGFWFCKGSAQSS